MIRPDDKRPEVKAVRSKKLAPYHRQQRSVEIVVDTQIVMLVPNRPSAGKGIGYSSIGNNVPRYCISWCFEVSIA
jgi:hypothetical protein